jgi:antitoxin component YwqK of YwqJK toxin-antitoxin module
MEKLLEEINRMKVLMNLTEKVMKLSEEEQPKKKLSTPKRLNQNRFTEWNNSQPIRNGKRINQYTPDGLKTGYWENSYPNTKGNYINEKKDGYWEGYHENGQLSFNGNYINGMKDGYWEIYYDNGILESEGNYVNGEKDGYWVKYYNNGKLESKGNYKNGKGELELYSRVGELDVKYNENNGYYESFHPTGGLRSKGYIKNDKKNGYWEFYFSNGDKRSETFFENGKVIKEKLFQSEKEAKRLMKPKKHRRSVSPKNMTPEEILDWMISKGYETMSDMRDDVEGGGYSMYTGMGGENRREITKLIGKSYKKRKPKSIETNTPQSKDQNNPFYSASTSTNPNYNINYKIVEDSIRKILKNII